MPFYKSIKNDTPAGKRTIEGLLRLKEALDVKIPSKQLDTRLLLATWNIREFGGTKYGGRDEEALFYLSEIISRFDLIAVQEVRDNLDALDALMSKLGGWWRYLVSDVTLGLQGNHERMAYIYDTRKLSFGGLAGELTPPMAKEGDTLVLNSAFARSPYLAGFRAGWFKFTICAQHLYYGDPKPDDPQRLKESQMAVDLLKERMKSSDTWAYNSILVGDFNIFSTNDQTFLALEKANFILPDSVRGQYTNLKLDKPFDQIAFLAPDVERQMKQVAGGVFPFLDYVYRDSDAPVYQPEIGDSVYFDWRTYKMSDHLPLWVELFVDFGTEYLQRKLAAPVPPVPPVTPVTPS
ncbi:MAG TPA: endonuclease/exonuclease/phosphatase family protein [Anaerolineaceae bacterium]|nr:endonuclease/exonuclease/phosphatase family protein [Anaerolineaceae bacterium]